MQPSSCGRPAGHGVRVVELDVTDDVSVDRAVGVLFERAGSLDVLINNAGIGSAGISEAFTVDQMRSLFEVNVFGIQRMSRAVLPVMRSAGAGLIVNIGSILDRVTFPFFGLYGASKFAVEVLSDRYRNWASTWSWCNRATTRPTYSRAHSTPKIAIVKRIW